MHFEDPIIELARSYQDTIPDGAGREFDEPFDLVVTLFPEIEIDEIEAWPAFERRRCEHEDSPVPKSVVTEI